MAFFKRLSRSRSNSRSYVDNYDSRHDSRHDSKHSYDAHDAKFTSGQVPSPTDLDSDHRQGGSHPQPNNSAPQLADPLDKDAGEISMYARRDRPTEISTQDRYHGNQYNPPHSAGSGRGPTGMNGFGKDIGSGGYSNESTSANKHEPTPDLLTQAFNQALRPYNDKIETLENEISDLRAYIDALERQRTEVHGWIDKRGLRPDVPASIAQVMDSASHASSPTHAAATLNAQLDRKITIVNFDLHRLQDDLNDSLPTPSFSACMLKFLPDITRLSSLPSGPRFAFDLLLKLGGNLNSHGGLENGDEEDLRERRAFYGRLDEAMVDVVRGRFREESDNWGVQREIKRIEKTGAYLRNWGVQPYFPNTLEVMREGSTNTQPMSASGGTTDYS